MLRLILWPILVNAPCTHEMNMKVTEYILTGSSLLNNVIPRQPPGVPQGFELVDAPGECCKKCQQTHCIITRPGKQSLVLKVRPPHPLRPQGRERPASRQDTCRGVLGPRGGFSKSGHRCGTWTIWGLWAAGPWAPPDVTGSAALGLWAALGKVVREQPGGLPPGLTQNPPDPDLQPGDMKSDPLNNCTFFSCVKIHNQLISSVSNITCPDFDPSTCVQVSRPVTPGVGP